MSTNTLKKYFVFIVIFLGSFRVASANLEITEVMYDPQGANTSHQWVEVYNNGSESIDLSSWFLADYDTSWHFRSISSDSTTILGSNSFAIIAKTSNLTDFKSKNPSLNGQLFKANITLGAESGKIGLSSDKKNIIGGISYSSPMDNGNSLQKIDGIWKEAVPTPGISNTDSGVNSTENTSGSTNDTTTSNTSISSSSNTSKTSIAQTGEVKITTKIISPSIVSAEIPFYVSSLTTTSKKETLISGRYVWNFGDGTSLETKSQQEIEHTYNYPGEYVLNLSYFNNYFEKIPVFTNRITIKVILADIVISSVGNGLDSFIEFENKSKYEIDISGFTIKGNSRDFIIPSGTIILPNHKLKFSSRITNFTDNDISSVMVVNKAGDVVTTYPQKELPFIKNTSNYNISDNVLNKKSNISKNPRAINLNDLAAQAGDIDNPINYKSAYTWFGLLGIIAIGVAFVLITRKNVASTPDYLEKEIRAEDMAIIE